MKVQIIACLAILATAQAVRDKRGYFGLHAVAEPVYHAPFLAPAHPVYHAPAVYHAPVYHAPVYHAPAVAIAKPAATSYSHFQSVVMSHPVARPVIAAAPALAFAHPVAYGHSFPSFAKYGGYGYHR